MIRLDQPLRVYKTIYLKSVKLIPWSCDCIFILVFETQLSAWKIHQDWLLTLHNVNCISWRHIWKSFCIRNTFVITQACMDDHRQSSFPKVPSLSQNWNFILWDAYSSGTRPFEPEKTTGLKWIRQLYRNVESIIYLINLNSLIYSECSTAFRMTLANTDDHYSMKYV